MSAKINVTLRHSPIGNTQRHKRTVRALGLTKMQQTVQHNDSPAVRGMIQKVRHLVEVEAVPSE